ncbi:olfactory receptor 9G4-like [Pituophis catenifer annectens]|uniref:olfactory receptor 9G4-like n=1 Tax=Pituophis catenifer annectens TaxID=94852 RepID=UPI003995F2C1
MKKAIATKASSLDFSTSLLLSTSYDQAKALIKQHIVGTEPQLDLARNPPFIDDEMAICNPLLYVTAMPKKLCVQLVVGAYAAGFANAIIHTGNTFRLHFCGNNVINHYFCDGPPLLKMTCNDIGVYELIVAAVLGSNLLVTTAIIVSSYIGIGAAIVNIRSAAGRRKAFFTCSAHLMSVSLFYGSILIMYLTPNFHHTPNWDKANALFYTVVNSLANPFIYSLRNKDVKAAFKKVWGRFTILK